jgi:hypothetical protein
MIPRVLYSIDGLDLVSGNKTAGFSVSLLADSARELAQRPIEASDADKCNRAIRETLARADLLPEAFIGSAGVAFYKNSMLPLAFIQDPIGGSLGFDRSELQDVLDRLGEKEGFGLPVLQYYAHNVDAAKQALALVVVVQVWSEWARAKLALEALAQADVKPKATAAAPV